MKTGAETLRHLAVVQAPRVLPPVVRLPRADGRRDYVFLGQVIGHFLGDLFPARTSSATGIFASTRNSELYIDEQDSGNLLKAIEKELHNRRKGDAVRLETDHDCPAAHPQGAAGHVAPDGGRLYLIDGPLYPARLMAIYEEDHPGRSCASGPLSRPPARPCGAKRRPFRRHSPAGHPAAPSVREFRQRGRVFWSNRPGDPRVLAIKQTLYRTGGDTRIVGALMEAASQRQSKSRRWWSCARGSTKPTTSNGAASWRRPGVHVVYGLVGYKIHCKMCLVVRKEEDGIRRYVHLSTGNYNPTTARLYTDVGLLTCQPDFGEDATNAVQFASPASGTFSRRANCCWRPLNCTGGCSDSSSARPKTPAAGGPPASSPR